MLPISEPVENCGKNAKNCSGLPGSAVSLTLFLKEYFRHGRALAISPLFITTYCLVFIGRRPCKHFPILQRLLIVNTDHVEPFRLTCMPSYTALLLLDVRVWFEMRHQPGNARDECDSSLDFISAIIMAQRASCQGEIAVFLLAAYSGPRSLIAFKELIESTSKLIRVIRCGLRFACRLSTAGKPCFPRR